MKLSINENSTMQTEQHRIKHNLREVKQMSHVLPEPLGKELFMAKLGLCRVNKLSETQSNCTYNGRTTIYRKNRQTSREARFQSCGLMNGRVAQVQNKIARRLNTNGKPEKPLHKMIIWLMDLPERCELSRFSFSTLRCNECYMCEGVEYPCVRCQQQFHQECHVDQGRRHPHRLCPSCTRIAIGGHQSGLTKHFI